MAILIPDAIIDNMLDEAEGTNIHYCSGPADTWEQISAVELATQAISDSYVKAGGSPNGRKSTVPAQTAVSVDTSGTANHIVISNGTDTLLLQTTCPGVAVSDTGTLDSAAFAHTIGDAS